MFEQKDSRGYTVLMVGVLCTVLMTGFMKTWYIREGKLLMKACTITVWNYGFMLGAMMLAWTGRKYTLQNPRYLRVTDTLRAGDGKF